MCTNETKVKRTKKKTKKIQEIRTLTKERPFFLFTTHIFYLDILSFMKIKSIENYKTVLLYHIY